MAFRDVDLCEQLHIVRSGTTYFAQCLGRLTDPAFDDDTLLPGWTRKHLVAHVAYNAAALCRLMQWAATGIETPMYKSAEHRVSEIEAATSLSAETLRDMFTCNASQLNEAWHRLPGPAWDTPVRTAQGRTVPASETIWMRTREVWIHAVDLDNGGQFDDIPEVVLQSLLTDIVESWQRRQIDCELSVHADGAIRLTMGGDVTRALHGPLPALVRWAAGRDAATAMPA
ncbi:MAG: maleylpyruvate isomerase family mycothiol-dependent enzyme, partial [Mycobacterium sp.]